MSVGFNHHQDEQQIPPLIPLRNKQEFILPQVIPSDGKNSIEEAGHFSNFMKDKIINTPKINQAAKFQVQMPNQEKIVEIESKARDKTTKINKTETKLIHAENEKSKQNEKSKFLISEMLSKISVKNLSEELYPASNEVVEQLLEEIDREIDGLKVDAEKKENAFAVSTNNITLKKELDAINREINHCSTIKLLYNEKLKYRNQIKILERDIINLKAENYELQLKVSRGIEEIERYKHNLPCDEEKSLKRQLAACKQELKVEKSTRENLENNIESIIINFKRLYEEADTARQIVVKKLKEVEERELILKNMKEDEPDSESEKFRHSLHRISSLEQPEQKRAHGTAYLEVGNDFSMTNYRKNSGDESRRNQGLVAKRQAANSGRQKQGKQSKQTVAVPTLEQKIKKMKNNQLTFNRFSQS